ncbi:MAG: XdhC family protein [Capsulimonadaceae bacterium]
MKDLERIAALLAELRTNPEPAALVTLAVADGPSYRRPGALMLVTRSGQTAGGVTAGCLEADVIEHARGVIRTGRAVSLTYDTSAADDPLMGLGMGCGGVLRIVVEPVDPDLCRWLAAGSTRHSPVALATACESSDGFGLGSCAWMWPDGRVEARRLGTDAETAAVIADVVLAVARHSARSQPVACVREYAGEERSLTIAINVLAAPQMLLICGGGDDAVILCRLARDLGWAVAVADIRKVYVNEERFPDATRVIPTSYEGLLPALPEPFATGVRDLAVVVMTHNARHDTDVLRGLLPLNAGYVGLLGARNRSARLLESLREGAPPEWDRLTAAVHTPAGLDIGATTPEAIALSIVSEIHSVMSGRPGGPLGCAS